MKEDHNKNMLVKRLSHRAAGSAAALHQSTRQIRNTAHHHFQKAATEASSSSKASSQPLPVLPSNPSISVSSWLSVCSRSSLPPPIPAHNKQHPVSQQQAQSFQEISAYNPSPAMPENRGQNYARSTLQHCKAAGCCTLSAATHQCYPPVPRLRPTASISSTNTRHGAFSFAFLKRSLTRLAPTPTNISTNSEPEMEKKGTPASPAMALASRVLPVPACVQCASRTQIQASGWCAKNVCDNVEGQG